MKKFLALGLSCVLTASLFTGCGEQKTENPPPAPASEVKTAQLGVIAPLNFDETKLNDENFLKEQESKVREIFENSTDIHKGKLFTNLNTMQMALESGQIQEMDIYKPVAEYLIAKNPKFEILENHIPKVLEDKLCFAFRTEDVELKAAADKAISEMKNDGTLDNLKKIYITDLKADTELKAVEFEKIDGADTLTVAVTGDLPPFDYVSADGKAAGFNTAVLAELGKRLQKNINIIQIESGARAATLTSKKADMVFWTFIPADEIVSANILPADLDKPEGIELSTPYYTCTKVHVGLKK